MLTQNDKDILTKRIERMEKLLATAKEGVEDGNTKGVIIMGDLIAKQAALLQSEAGLAEDE